MKLSFSSMVALFGLLLHVCALPEPALDNILVSRAGSCAGETCSLLTVKDFNRPKRHDLLHGGGITAGIMESKKVADECFEDRLSKGVRESRSYVVEKSRENAWE
ncbi:hypothetical protein GALMADRAFT_214005 [Galerina marginata CBS 339.88]|uniref:Uncharacterized protein n=1 Tax=Galerina marginata (strain CBS 339.88) TaxID=685588 RepID=A0A067SMU8_GALM3|nr:hypothetical protein GALMADRAFT_214005 [Galerina marginata CBS 339.88]